MVDKHDLLSQTNGMAVPNGIYELQLSIATVSTAYFGDFLKIVEKQTTKDMKLHVTVDNYSTQQAPESK